jgi:exportin-5
VALVARGRPLEARHFGYGVLQHVCAERWDEFAADERQHLAKLAWEKLTELAGAADAGGSGSAPPEPFVIKSKAATLLATVVRREGAALWAGVVPDLCAMTSSGDADAAELAALVTRYVAEDVAVYNSDIIGGRMKDLLGGLTATLPQTLPALYRGLEVRVVSSFPSFPPLPPPGIRGQDHIRARSSRKKLVSFTRSRRFDRPSARL